MAIVSLIYEPWGLMRSLRFWKNINCLILIAPFKIFTDTYLLLYFDPGQTQILYTFFGVFLIIFLLNHLVAF